MKTSWRSRAPGKPPGGQAAASRVGGAADCERAESAATCRGARVRGGGVGDCWGGREGVSRGGMLLTSRNNTQRGRRAIHLPSLQTKPLSHLERRLLWEIAVTRGEGNKQVLPTLSQARSAVA